MSPDTANRQRPGDKHTPSSPTIKIPSSQTYRYPAIAESSGTEATTTGDQARGQLPIQCDSGKHGAYSNRQRCDIVTCQSLLQRVLAAASRTTQKNSRYSDLSEYPNLGKFVVLKARLEAQQRVDETAHLLRYHGGGAPVRGTRKTIIARENEEEHCFLSLLLHVNQRSLR